jgi:hypothetical protein
MTEARPARGRLLPRLAVAALAAFSARPAAGSDGASPTVIGPKGPVSIPVDGDAQTAFRMPSSIAWAPGSRIDLDAFLFGSIVTVRNATNDFRQSGLGPGGSGGFVLSLPGPGYTEPAKGEPEPDVTTGRLQLHVGEYVEVGGAGGVSKLHSITYPEGKNTMTGLGFLTTAATVAYAPVEWIGIGASFHFIYATLKTKSLIGGGSAQLEGSPKINGVPLPGNPTYTDFINLFSTGQDSDPATYVETDNMTSFQVSGTLALSLRPMSNLGFGLAYSPTSLVLNDFQGTALVDGRRTVALAVNGLDPKIQSLFLSTLPDGGQNGYVSNYKIRVYGLRTPETVRANFVFWPLARLLIGAEVAWYEWCRALSPTAVLTNGSNRDLNFMVGSSSVVTHISVRWNNEWVYSLYAAFGVTDELTLRLGFNYGGNPVNELYIGNGPSSAIVSMTVTAGAGFRIGNFEISTLFECSPYNHAHSDGRPDSVSSKFAAYSARQFLVHLGVGYAF